MPQNIDKYWSDIYATGRDFNFASAGLITKFLAHTDPALARTCLDVGCGTGQLSRELFHRGYSVVGIDSSAKAIELAQSLTVMPWEQLSYFHLNIEKDDGNILADKTFSLITCKLVYAFIKDKARFLERIASLLPKNGTFVVITPLYKDVLPEKRGIAVDYEQTMTELQTAFQSVKSYENSGVCVFVCRN